MRILAWIRGHLLLTAVLFLLAFIPLYPKLPLLGVQHTWVYIRLDDIAIAVSILLLGIQLLRHKATLKTPLTIPIGIYWLVGAVSLGFALKFIFPHIANVFPSVALLNWLRYVEYLSVFFLAYSAVRDKKSLNSVVVVSVLTVLAVVFYGLGQKGLIVGWAHRFPAFSTMNEEFAKGIPLQLSALDRVSSTFAGHYDLAAYLVMLIALLGSLIFGVKKIWMKIVLFLTAFGGLILLMMTNSRTSFAVYLIAVIFMLIIQKQKKYIIPVILLSILLLQGFQGLNSRFTSTLSQVNVVVDARTGKPIGIANPDSTGQDLVIEQKDLTGENLPQGSGFINLPGDDQSTANQVTYKRIRLKDGSYSTSTQHYQGDFVVRKALAYDISFTTRFQGEWPRAINAFKRNLLLGSGYSSISLATDNNYLRILGETGLLGFASYVLIFIVFGIYAYRILPNIEPGVNRSFILGVISALLGLALNAVLIDVFVASKDAYITWILIGLAMGVLALYEKRKVKMLHELRLFFLSAPMIIFYFLIAAFLIFAMILPNFFVGDDFTWLHWAADCKKIMLPNHTSVCEPISKKVMSYFTDANGFFYRPGTKVYFMVMYAVFWLHQEIYHIVSIFLHFLATACVFILALRLLKKKLFATLVGILFLVLSVHFESIFWASVTGHMIAIVSMLMSLIFYIYWRDTRHYIFLLLAFMGAVVAPFFQEFGIVLPLLLLSYDLIFVRADLKKEKVKNGIVYALFFLLIPAYLVIRYLAHSHWQGGDYTYNLVKLPFNVIGNLFGYVGLTFGSVHFMPFYESLRTNLRSNIPMLLVGLVIVVAVVAVAWIYRRKLITMKEGKVFLFGLVFFVINLLPFLGFGNITFRYVYLPSAGLLIALFALIVSWYDQLKASMKKMALALIILVVAVYSVFQVIDLQNINKDWYKAGLITSGTIDDVARYYELQPVQIKHPIMYFVNVPIRYGQAWVFPVGLDDALWQPFQNNPATVRQMSSVDQALQAAEATSSARVFDFDKNGYVVLVNKK